ncbi:MAG: hypothetical protein A2Z14_00885 [Chloroflexi bacterium RBG_16_48_8]|nr:MAG: hypothetical protein A2Z14_00885 [Chloroflexi bacterium RBG_16_48_8]
MREPVPMPATPAPAPVKPVISQGPPPRSMADKPPRKRPSWLLAGCGCLVIIAVLVAVFWYMDINHPDILYAPLRLLGF